jgi:hypothetical protein
MKTIILALCLSACATVPEGVQITVSEAKAAQCLAHGGCGLLSMAQVREMLQKAHDEGLAEARGELDTHGCVRGNV